MQFELLKPRECRYSLRQCHKSALDGYQYCRTHILEDKSSPYKQCSYMSIKTGRRCTQATYKPQKKDGLCLQHSTKINRTRCAVARDQLNSNADTADSLLESLEHYSKTLYNNNTARGDKKGMHSETASSYIAELASSSDSDIDDKKYTSSSVWQPDSDSESVDSENEDTFKYAAVLTDEEVTRITRDKLIRLQSLYIDQFKWLQNALRERRRKYLHAKSNSKQSAHTDTEQAEVESDDNDTSYKEDPSLPQYLASKRYHRRHGQEALMYMKSQERRRTAGDPSLADGPNFNRYRHSNRHGTKYCSVKAVKCHEKSLPFTRYCLKHIENDNQQLLFKRCRYEAVAGGLRCERIVPNINEYTRCRYHNNVQDYRAMDSKVGEESMELVDEVDNLEDVRSISRHSIISVDDFSALQSPSSTPINGSAPAEEMESCGMGAAEESQS